MTSCSLICFCFGFCPACRKRVLHLFYQVFDTPELGNTDLTIAADFNWSNPYLQIGTIIRKVGTGVLNVRIPIGQVETSICHVRIPIGQVGTSIRNTGIQTGQVRDHIRNVGIPARQVRTRTGPARIPACQARTRPSLIENSSCNWQLLRGEQI